MQSVILYSAITLIKKKKKKRSTHVFETYFFVIIYTLLGGTVNTNDILVLHDTYSE